MPLRCGRSVKSAFGKARVRPSIGRFYQPVPHRILRAMLHCALKIVAVADGVFAKAALPDAFFSACGGYGLCKARFDPPPAFGVKYAPAGFGPDCVQMIGQDHLGVAQAFDVIGQQTTAPRLQPYGEEIGGARKDQVVNVCHTPIVAQIS